MIAWLAGLWPAPAPVEFESAFAMQESVERLRMATGRFRFLPVTRQEAVGTVTESCVSLQRAIPMVGNSFKPFYRGHFVERNGRIVLTGRFAMHWFVKAFMTLWFGALTFSLILGSFQVRSQPRTAAPLALVGVVMILAGAALMWLGKWFARNDREWLSSVIASALHMPAGARTAHVYPAAPAADSGQPSQVVGLVAAALAFAGLLTIAAAFLDIRSAHSDSSGFAVVRFSSEISRAVIAIYGAMLLVLAAGIYQRRLLAWRAGIGLLALQWVYSAARLLVPIGAPVDYRAAIFICIAGFLVTFIWIRWWYAQRMYFHE